MSVSLKKTVLLTRPAARCRDEAIIVEGRPGRAFVVRDGAAELGRDIWSAREAWRQAHLGLLAAAHTPSQLQGDDHE